jgi:hypothetical protein
MVRQLMYFFHALFLLDLGSGMEKNGSGKSIPDPQHGYSVQSEKSFRC